MTVEEKLRVFKVAASKDIRDRAASNKSRSATFELDGAEYTLHYSLMYRDWALYSERCCTSKRFAFLGKIRVRPGGQVEAFIRVEL